MDEFLVCFPLLKSREKLHQQDIIWKQICDDLNWEFIKSCKKIDNIFLLIFFTLMI